MSVATKIARLAVDLGEDLAERAFRALGEDASEAEVKAVVRKAAPKPRAAAPRPSARPAPPSIKRAASSKSTLAVARGQTRRVTLGDIMSRPAGREDVLSAVQAGRLPKLSEGFQEVFQAPPDAYLHDEFVGVPTAPVVREATLPMGRVRMPQERGVSELAVKNYADMPAHTAPPPHYRKIGARRF